MDQAFVNLPTFMFCFSSMLARGGELEVGFGQRAMTSADDLRNVLPPAILSALRDPDIHIVTPAVDFLERFAQVLRLSITSVVPGVSTVAAEDLGLGDLGSGRALGSQLLVCPYSDECGSYLRFVLLRALFLQGYFTCKSVV